MVIFSCPILRSDVAPNTFYLITYIDHIQKVSSTRYQSMAANCGDAQLVQGIMNNGCAGDSTAPAVVTLPVLSMSSPIRLTPRHSFFLGSHAPSPVPYAVCLDIPWIV